MLKTDLTEMLEMDLTDLGRVEVVAALETLRRDEALLAGKVSSGAGVEAVANVQER